MTKPYSVYCLVSAKGRTYVGVSNNVERRLRQHNREIVGGARATRVRPGEEATWRLLFVVQGLEKRTALQLEWRLHRRQHRPTPLCSAHVGLPRSNAGVRVVELYRALTMRDCVTSTANPTRSWQGVSIEWHDEEIATVATHARHFVWPENITLN